MTDHRHTMENAVSRSPKDTFITVYGRMPVLEVLQDSTLKVDKLVVADNARGDNLDRILTLATHKGISVKTATAHRVKVLAGNGKHDQGIIADVVAPQMWVLTEFLAHAQSRKPHDSRILVLDGVSNPSNVGMILRTATAAGITGIVLPRVGSPSVDPLVIKASAGVAFRAPILRCRTAEEGIAALSDAGYQIFGLSGEAGNSLYEKSFAHNSVFVLGNETEGISTAAKQWIKEWISIPMMNNVESLNVASTAAVLCFELIRRERSKITK